MQGIEELKEKLRIQQSMNMNGMLDEQIKELEYIINGLEHQQNCKIEIIEEGWNVPMPTRKDIITDKKFNYELLGEITLISNRKTEFLEDVDISDAEEHRYIYEKGENSILSNKDFLEEISGCKWDTIKRNLRKLAKCNNDIVSYCQDERGRAYYKIMPYTVGNNGKLQYVTVDSRILEYLCRYYNSNIIKVYCTILWILWDNEKKCYIKKWITRDWLCRQIGLSSNSGKNISIIGEIVATLENLSLIEREKETDVIKVNGENSIVKTRYYYSIGNINDFFEKIKYHK